jgi:hypothetical protein
MKTIIQATASLFFLASSAMAQNPAGDDPFFGPEPVAQDLEELNYELVKKAGITIESVSPAELGFGMQEEGMDPELGGFRRDEIFVRVTFDCSKLAKEQWAHMNVQFMIGKIGKDLRVITTQDVGRKKGDGDKLEMTFHVTQETLEHSYLTILISRVQTEAQKRNGTLLFDSKTLTVRRIIELAKKNQAGK